MEDNATEKPKPKNYKKCKACGFVGPPVKLGQHYLEYPSHKPAPWDKNKKYPEDPEAAAFQPGWKGGPGRPEGSKNAVVRDRVMVEHFLNVVRLRNGEEVDDSVAEGIFKWCEEDAKNMRTFMERVMILLGERLTPAQMSSDERELREMEIEAIKHRDDTGSQGQVINIIAPNLPIPNVNENMLEGTKIIENVLSLSNNEDSVIDVESNDLGKGWDDFGDEI